MKLAIYGAQGVALAAASALKELYPKREIVCFLVTERGMNAPVLGGIPVRELHRFAAGLAPAEKQEIEILIATPENVQPEIEESLENYGFIYHQRLDSNRWSDLMKLYYVRQGRFLPLSALPVGYREPFVRIFMARSHKDRPLRSTIQLPQWMFPVQAGAALTAQRIADIPDYKGEHISEKNVNYSELTVLYWMWKNKLYMPSDHDDNHRQYYGLAQYRRMLDLDADDLLRLLDNDVDVVLPYPMPYDPDANAHHERYLKETDWHALLQASSELQPEYADAFPEILAQPCLYNYNVILAKKTVLRDYCAWLFPILARTEELSNPKGSERADRYIGYMGETLETLYFMKNADRLNIVHTACRFIV
ncbi:MAG: DUF4422 domain-containing protein [Lachnospiraceae bacterium]|nr:DUF4422 domain-containing protein [Lachnospiraceae bacterium]